MQVAAHVFFSLPISLCHSRCLFEGCEEIGREFRAVHEDGFKWLHGSQSPPTKQRFHHYFSFARFFSSSRVFLSFFGRCQNIQVRVRDTVPQLPCLRDRRQGK
jgi:hypothetical protein